MKAIFTFFESISNNGKGWFKHFTNNDVGYYGTKFMNIDMSKVALERNRIEQLVSSLGPDYELQVKNVGDKYWDRESKSEKQIKVPFVYIGRDLRPVQTAEDAMKDLPAELLS
tara:strand:+ start:39 stop:377 length:339 start_codon:yes stop_codon:yes gene_type:complete